MAAPPQSAQVGGDFTGRQSIIAQVCEILQKPEKQAGLAGGPKTGRTTLLRYLAGAEAKKKYPVLGDFVTVYMSGEAVGSTMTAAEFWIRVFRDLEPYANDNTRKPVQAALRRASQGGKIRVYELEDVFDVFGKIGRPVALLVDDFDCLLRNRNFWPPDDFFHMVRSVTQRFPRGVTFVVAAPRGLLQLWDFTRGASPFYNTFHTIKMGSFSQAEIEEYVSAQLTGLVQALGWKPDDPATQRLFGETVQLVAEASDGHPYLVYYTTHFCVQCLAHRKDQQPVPPTEVENEFRKPEGPLVRLVREIRARLTAEEKALLDRLKREPKRLNVLDAERLWSLREYGLLPPGTRLPK
jgi:hypothetical protein